MNNKNVQSKNNIYRYGAISASIGCMLSLLNLIEWHWFFILTVFYIGGMAAFLIQSGLKNDSPHALKSKQNNLISKNPTSALDTAQVLPTQKKSNNLNQYSQLFQDYDRLQQQSTSFLNPTSQYYMTEIQKIMQFIQQKLDQHTNDTFKFEIIEIQRTLNAYLMPALRHFSDLPPFLRERKIIDQQSPSQLLEQQLAMILDEFKNIAESIYLNDLNKLIDHGQYLKYKLKQQDDFNIIPSAMDKSN